MKRASGLVAAVAAPLFIPSERLDFGVPTQRLVVPELEVAPIYGVTLEKPSDMRGYFAPVLHGTEIQAHEAAYYLGAGRTVSFDLTISSPTVVQAFDVRLQESVNGAWQDIAPLRTGDLRSFKVRGDYVRAVYTSSGGLSLVKDGD